MTDVPVTGFWSYVHADDHTDEGRIRQLATDLQSQFEAITAGSLTLFVDRTSLDWGDDWRARINEAIAQAAFLIPVITPRYFTSQACRDELLAFASQAEAAGVADLVLPIYWITVRELEYDPTVDEVTALVAARQRQDLRIARLEDRGSSVYRRAVHELATALADRSERISTAVVDVPTRAVVGDDAVDEDEGLGLVEMLAEGEGALEEITPTLSEIGVQIETVGSLMEEATAEVGRAEARGQGFAARVRVAAKLANELQGPSRRIAQLGQDYGAALVKIDPMVRTLIEAGQAATDPDEQAAAREMFDSIEDLIQASEGSLGQLREMVEAAKGIARMSSTMRPTLRELNRGLQGVLDSSAVFADWKRLLEAENATLESAITKGVGDIHAEHAGRPLSGEEFERVFGHLPSDGEG